MTNNATPLWYKDAIIYEVHVKSFYDSTDNGIGDIQGITEKLDYLADLGITAIWLLPFYPSPLRDDGYDIADYMNIHQNYGKLKDFKKMLREAHKLGLKVITELVLNHTSDQHAWFKRARKAKPGSSHRNFYVWNDTTEKYREARIIFKDFETSNWTWDPVAGAYYWHRFYHHQPDLNYENPQVVKEVFRVIDHWLDMGVDGMRLDAVPYIYEEEGTNCENLPRTYEFLKKLRAHMDEKYENRMLLAEANQWPEDAAKYFGEGDSCHMSFHFPLMPRMFMSLHMEDRYPIIDILEQTPDIPENCQWAVFLRNHDELTLEMVTDEERDYMYRMYARDPKARINLGIRRRLAPLLSNDRRKIELMNVMLMSMPGSPVLYYGDELGMGDNYYLGDRDGVRTPMQWSADRNAGFSKANPQSLYLPVIIDPEYHYEAVNVETQQRNNSSLLWWTKRFIAMRKRFKAFGHGTIKFLLPQNPKILAYIREYGDEKLLVVINLSQYPQFASLEMPELAGMVPEEVFSRTEFPEIKTEDYPLSLNSHGYYIFNLVPESAQAAQHRELPTISAPNKGQFVDQSLKDELEAVLPDYILRKGYLGKGRGKLGSVTILESLPIGSSDQAAWLMVIQADYVESHQDVFNLLISFVYGSEAEDLRAHNNPGIVCLTANGEAGVVVEGTSWGGGFPGLLPLAARKQVVKVRHGELEVIPGRQIRMAKDVFTQNPMPASPYEKSFNTVLTYDKAVLFKIFRRTQEGLNPDMEVSKFLTETVPFAHTPKYLGSVGYNIGTRQYLLGVLKEYVHVESDAWNMSLSSIQRFLSKALSETAQVKNLSGLPRSVADAAFTEPPERITTLFGESQTEVAQLMGKRTAQLHLALCQGEDIPEFAPEPFNKLYRRSVYQDIQSRAKRVLRRLERKHKILPEKAQALSRAILDNREKLYGKLLEFRDTPIRSLKIRVHGHYHLKHLLFTGKDFMVIDFEGKTDKPMSARRLKRSPFRDVGDIVRSMHQVAYHALMEAPMIRPEDRESLVPWLNLWYTYTAGRFTKSYIEHSAGAEYLPGNEAHTRLLLDTFILDKCLIELQAILDTEQGQIMNPLSAIAAKVED